MLLKTHFALGILMIIIFFEHVQNTFQNKLIFVIMVIVATAIPDLDDSVSSFGRYMIFRPLQFFTKHRGIVHSFTIAVVLSFIIAIYWPVASLGFFIGYSVHLITDSFTITGIQPFWPLKMKSRGWIHSGGRIEESLFFSLIFIDIILFFIVIIF